MIERAGTAPLTIELPSDILNWKWNLNSYRNCRLLAFNHVHRARHFRFLDDSRPSGLSELAVDMVDHVNQEYLALDYVAIISSVCHQGNFPISIFEQIGTPKSDLRHLHLQNWNLFNLPLGTIPLLFSISRIKVLEIHLTETKSPQLTPIHQIICCLKHLPHLEILSLQHVFGPITPEDRSAHSSNNPLFRLLKEIHLSGAADRCGLFLERLQFPVTVLLTLNCYCVAGEHICPTYDRLLLCIKKKTEARIYSVRLQSCGQSDSPTFVLNAWYIGNSKSNELDLEKPDVVIQMPPMARGRMMDGVFDVMNALPLEEVEQFFYCLLDSDEECWSRLSTLPKLRTLNVRFNHGTFFEALEPSHSKEGGYHLVPFPALRHLSLGFWDFAQEGHGRHRTPELSFARNRRPQARSGVPSIGPSLLQDFMRVISSRRRLEHGPVSLSLFGCAGVTSVDIGMLEELFEDVRVSNR